MRWILIFFEESVMESFAGFCIALLFVVCIILAILDMILGAIFGGHPIISQIQAYNLTPAAKYVAPRPIPPAQQRTFKRPIKKGGEVMISLLADGSWKLALRDADQGVHETVLGPIRNKDAQKTFKLASLYCEDGPLTKEKAESVIARIQAILPPYPVRKSPGDPPTQVSPQKRASPPPQAETDKTEPIPIVPPIEAPEKLPGIPPVKPARTFQTNFYRTINRGGDLAMNWQPDNTWQVISHDAEGNAYEANLGELEPNDARNVFNRIPYLTGPINPTFGQKMVDWAKDLSVKIPAERIRREEDVQRFKQKLEAQRQQSKERRQYR